MHANASSLALRAPQFSKYPSSTIRSTIPALSRMVPAGEINGNRAEFRAAVLSRTSLNADRFGNRSWKRSVCAKIWHRSSSLIVGHCCADRALNHLVLAGACPFPQLVTNIIIERDLHVFFKLLRPYSCLSRSSNESLPEKTNSQTLACCAPILVIALKIQRALRND